jgi:splicing factor 3B subunit 4
MQNKPEQDRNQEATVYLVSGRLTLDLPPRLTYASLNNIADAQGNLDDRCTDALIWELML